MANKICNMRPDATSVDSLCELVDFTASRSNSLTMNMIEIGSYAGQSMEAFVNTGKIGKITCIDPWQSGYDPFDVASGTDMKIVESEFDKRSVGLNDKAEIVKYKGTLSSFVQSDEFKKLGSVDFVYIDGDHRYEGCKSDIQLCRDVIKPKIAICGHDWYENAWLGVRRAVTELLGNPDKVFKDSSWCKIL